MIKWTLVILYMGATSPTVMPGEYPSEALCKGAGEFVEDSKFWCVPMTMWNGIDPIEPQEDLKEEKG